MDRAGSTLFCHKEAMSGKEHVRLVSRLHGHIRASVSFVVAVNRKQRTNRRQWQEDCQHCYQARQWRCRLWAVQEAEEQDIDSRRTLDELLGAWVPCVLYLEFDHL